MSKKNLEEIDIPQPEPMSEKTRPVKISRKVFKDNPEPQPESVYETGNEEIEKTTPVKAQRKMKPATQVSMDNGNGLSPVEDKPKKIRHGKWVWLGILIMLVITAIGASFGYWSAMKARQIAETSERIERATTQYLMAEKDQQNGNLEMAQQRLEYIMTIYPDYPGLTEKLTEVMLALSLSNPQTTATEETPVTAVTAVATTDTTNLSILFQQAQDQLKTAQQQNSYDRYTCWDMKKAPEDRAIQPWEALLITVNQMRNLDPSYEAIKVDGLYYIALRYYGIANINSGKLEEGIYYLTMAETIAPLDSDAESWKYQARAILIAGSWYGINWQNAADGFYDIYRNFPNAVDLSCKSVKELYSNSIEGIGDTYMSAYDYDYAATQYQSANEIYPSTRLDGKIQLALEYFANPPATPTPTIDPFAPTPTDEP